MRDESGQAEEERERGIHGCGLYEGKLQANAGTESWEGDLETRGRYEELVRSKWKG